MWLAVFSGLLVSVDALFIGVSFGTQKKCRFWHILVINTVLLGLCFLGYIFGRLIGGALNFELDIVIGVLFISLGLWVIIGYYLQKRKKDKEEKQGKNIILTGAFMSIEAMFITVGLTLVLDVTTILIPVTVGLAHLVYCVTTFFLAKYLRKLPAIITHLISGVALICYGTMAILL